MMKLKDVLEGAEYDYWYYKHIQRGRMPRRMFVWSCALSFLWYKIRSVYCKLFGHKWKEEGSFTPDSGISEMTCLRCGESHRQVWY